MTLFQSFIIIQIQKQTVENHLVAKTKNCKTKKGSKEKFLDSFITSKIENILYRSSPI